MNWFATTAGSGEPFRLSLSSAYFVGFNLQVVTCRSSENQALEWPISMVYETGLRASGLAIIAMATDTGIEKFGLRDINCIFDST